MERGTERLGAVLTLIGAVAGVAGTILLFVNWYQTLLTGCAEPACDILLTYVMPALSDLGILAGVLYAVSAYGFATHRSWAFRLAVLATVLALQGSFFLNIPLAAADMPPVYFALFLPNLILYFLIMWLVGRLPWRRTLLGLCTGMAFVLCMMNGIASWNKMITNGAPIFFAVQRLHWISMIGWGVATVGILIGPADWMRIVGLAAALLELVVGIPLGVSTTIALGRFSMFSVAPLLSLVLLVVFLWVGLWRRLSGATD
jgi:hypothetical protein